jgi:purine-binding chemotaxis protein CheW
VNLGDLRADEADQAGAAEGRDAERFLVAEAGGQPVALPLLQAREIVTVRAVTRLPGAPSFIAGLVNVRGTVLTVVDVGQRLGGAASAGPVVVVAVAERTFGLRVERVQGVRRAEAGVEAVDEARSAGGAVRGLVMAGGDAALVLDLEALQRAAIADA